MRFSIPILVISAWALIVLYRMYLTGRAREQLHRERIAMIEKGLVPPPESDPQRFERMMDWHPGRAFEDRGSRNRRVGFILLAIGLAISIQGYLALGTRLGWGAGVPLIFIGLAFLVNAMFEPRPRQSDPQRPQEK